MTIFLGNRMIQPTTKSAISQLDFPSDQRIYTGVSVVVPGNFEDYIDNDPIFRELGLECNDIIEVAFYGWGYKGSNGLYDLLAEHAHDTFFDRVPPEVMKGEFDRYHNAIVRVMDKLEPRLSGLDKPVNAALDYCEIAGCEPHGPSPCFIVRLVYDSGTMTPPGAL